MATVLNFTKRGLLKLPGATGPTPDKYKDSKTPELYLYAYAEAKTFHFYKKMAGRPIRAKIGRFPDVTVEQARKRALEHSNSVVVLGIDPNDEKRRQRQQGITLQTALEQYLEYARDRADKPLRDSTAENYKRSMKLHFKKWLTKPAEDISDDDVEKWYNQAAKVSVSSANSALRIGRAVFNRQSEISRKQKTGVFTSNPFSHVRMKKESARSACIESTELPEWFGAVDKLTNATTRDYLKVLLFTGLRRREASTLTWKNVDLRKQTLTVRETKNGSDHLLPISDYLSEILTRRKLESVSEWVFPSDLSKNGYLAEPKTAIKRIVESSGIDASPHALRRTFSNIALFQAGIPDFARKRLLNHAIDASNVTDTHYTSLTLEQLREYQQKVTDTILECGGQVQTTPISAEMAN